MLKQFESYLQNQITNPFIEDEDRVEFTEVKEVYREDIFVIAETNAGTYVYEPIPYMTFEDTGDAQYDFIFEEKRQSKNNDLGTGYYLTAVIDKEETIIKVADLNDLISIHEKFSDEGVKMVGCYDVEADEDITEWVTT